MLDKMVSSDWRPHLNGEFRIPVESGPPLIIKLVEVAELGRAPSGEEDGIKRQAFSLVFRFPAGCRLAQGNFRIEHDSLGELVLFLVPIGPDKEGVRYEAVFT